MWLGILFISLQEWERNNKNEIWTAAAAAAAYDCLFFCPLGIKQFSGKTYTVHFIHSISSFKYMKMALNQPPGHKNILLQTVDVVNRRMNEAKFIYVDDKKKGINNKASLVLL